MKVDRCGVRFECSAEQASDPFFEVDHFFIGLLFELRKLGPNEIEMRRCRPLQACPPAYSSISP